MAQAQRWSARALLGDEQQDSEIQPEADPAEDREPHEGDAQKDGIDAEMRAEAAADAADEAAATGADQARARTLGRELRAGHRRPP